jgi:uncharacterized RDD family membrane protein YckC
MPPPPPPSFAYANQYREYAGFWRRFAGSVIDSILLGVISLVIQFPFIDWDFEDNGFAANVGGGPLGWVLTVAGWAVVAWFLSAKGQTPGMMAFGLRCQRKDTGANLSFWPAFGRSAMSIISGCVCLLGYFWMLWDDDKQTWHDKVVDSVVVRT